MLDGYPAFTQKLDVEGCDPLALPLAVYVANKPTTIGCESWHMEGKCTWSPRGIISCGVCDRVAEPVEEPGGRHRQGGNVPFQARWKGDRQNVQHETHCPSHRSTDARMDPHSVHWSRLTFYPIVVASILMVIGEASHFRYPYYIAIKIIAQRYPNYDPRVPHLYHIVSGCWFVYGRTGGSLQVTSTCVCSTKPRALVGFFRSAGASSWSVRERPKHLQVYIYIYKVVYIYIYL